MLPLLLFFGCAGNIHQLYQSEKDSVLGAPSPAAEQWHPDIRIRLSQDSLQVVTTAAVEGGLLDSDKSFVVDGPLGLKIKLRPKARVTKLRVGPGDDCEACLSVTAALKGAAQWQAGPLDGSLPFTANLGGTVHFAAAKADGGWDLTGQLTGIKDLTVSVGSVKQVKVGPEFKKWLKKGLSNTKPLHLGHIGGRKLPLRKLRVSSKGNQLEVQALSDVPGGGPVTPGEAALASGWELRISEATVGAMLRRQAFNLGLLEKDIALDPRSIYFDGESFTMDLRLWRLAGAGWWRDYRVTGAARIKDGKITLRSRDAIEGEKSKGAGFADPIALLGEGQILDAVASGIRQAVPASRSTKVGGATLIAEAQSLHGDIDALVLTGTTVLQ